MNSNESRAARYAFSALFLSLLVTPAIVLATTPSTEEVVYVVNSYVHNLPIPTHASVSMHRGTTVVPIKSLTIAREAHTVAVSPDMAHVWVSCPPANSICVVNPQTFEIDRTIDLGDIVIERPEGIAFTPSGSEVWVTYANARKVAAYDPATVGFLTSFVVGGAPDSCCSSRAGARHTSSTTRMHRSAWSARSTAS
ncbi:MAG: hypothetical protein HYR85_11825 [Planctomycetes bacterium]|nr:hypothetical protein [Planctomycetota bacterium]MBI3843971.1 hypothetical protein [Planctomycetota bacterium]